MGQEWTVAGTATEFHFAGFEWHDWAANLEPTPFRNYASTEGRWPSPDPLGGDVTNPQSLNRYAYVMNNPTTFVDPLGLETINYGSTGPPPCETQSGPLSPMTSCYTQFGI
jgi:RHS repeat-associated protein